MGLKTKRIGTISGLLVLMFILVASVNAQPQIPTPPLPPIFTDLNITPAEIEPRTEVTISFTITNSDNQTLNYTVNMQIGELNFPIDVELEAYESKTVSRTIIQTIPGDYNVTIDSLEGSFTVKFHDIPTPPLPPFLDNLNITPAEIKRGDNVTISFDIRNIDSQSITYGVDMNIENAAFPPPFWPPYDVTLRIWVDLEAYESKTVSRTITLDMIGEYHVWVEGLTGIFTVGTWPPEPPLTPAELVLSDLSIEPEEAELFEGIDVWNFKITVNVTNVGEQEGMDKINLRVDGSIVDWRTVKLGGGEQGTIMFDVMRGVGSYTVEVDGLTGSFVVLRTLKPAEVELSELEALGRQALIHDDEGRPIVEGEYVIFTVLVKNIGEMEGTHTVEFKVRRLDRQTLWDLETIDTQNVTLAAGRGRHARAYYEALNTGTYQVSVGNLTETFTVRAPLEPAEFEFSNLQITPRVKIGMSVNISVDVTNVGEMMGFCTVELKVNGRVVDSVDIPSFGGGVTATQFFELTRGEGTYEVEVEGLTGRFTVFTKPEPPFWTSPEFVMVVIIIIAAAVILYAYWKGILPSATTRSNSHGA